MNGDLLVKASVLNLDTHRLANFTCDIMTKSKVLSRYGSPSGKIPPPSHTNSVNKTSVPPRMKALTMLIVLQPLFAY